MLAYLSISIGLFLIALGLVAIYIGILTYIRLYLATVVTTETRAHDRHIVFIHGLSEADTPLYCPSGPLFMLAYYLEGHRSSRSMGSTDEVAPWPF